MRLNIILINIMIIILFLVSIVLTQIHSLNIIKNIYISSYSIKSHQILIVASLKQNTFKENLNRFFYKQTKHRSKEEKFDKTNIKHNFYHSIINLFFIINQSIIINKFICIL